MFSDAMDDGLIDANPFAKLGIPTGKGRKNIVAITEDELHEIADQALEAWSDDAWASRTGR